MEVVWVSCVGTPGKASGLSGEVGGQTGNQIIDVFGNQCHGCKSSKARKQGKNFKQHAYDLGEKAPSQDSSGK